MPIKILCTTTKSPGARANKPITDPARTLGLSFTADRKAKDLKPSLSDLPFPAAAFANVTWVSLNGFCREIDNYEFLQGFPALKEIRFDRGNVSLEGVPEQITLLVISDAALQNLERSRRFYRFDKIRIAPISNYEARALGEHSALRELSVTSAFMDPQIDASNWAQLNRLERLTVHSIPFQSLGFLPHMAKLKHLCADCMGLQSLQSITHLSLESLQWTELHLPQDMVKLAQFTGLKRLILYQRLQSLDQLAGLTGMEVLKAGAISGDLSALAQMPNLKDLETSVPPGVDLSPLAMLPNLSRLSLSFNDGSMGIYLKTRKAIRERFQT